MNRLIFLSIILIITILGTIGYFTYSIYYHKSSSSTLLYFPKGTSTLTIARQLEFFGVINNPKIFIGLSYLARLNGKKIQSGEYSFDNTTNMLSVLNKLISGNQYVRKITIPEGLTNYQIDNILNTAIGLIPGKIIVSECLEGSLMPDTYYYYFGDNKDIIITKMSDASKNFLNKHRTKNHNPTLLKSDQELLILASIVEKEAKQKEEMPIIASVYLNRLKKGMIFQADPTVLYAVSNKTGELGRLLTKNDLTIDSPYNTYKYKALPPSPIAAPSRDAILAVLSPSNTTYLYFVADGYGGHRFATSLTEHNKNVTAFRSTMLNR